MNMWQTIWNSISQFYVNTGFHNLHGDQLLMVLIGLALILLAVARRKKALPLMALGFGLIVGNMPVGETEKAILEYANGHGIFTMKTLFKSLVINPDLLPTLLFLGIGMLIDFGPLIANPRLAIVGSGAQIGIFLALLLGVLLGLEPYNAAVAAVVGGAHAPLAIFAAANLNQNLIGVAALAAYAGTLAASQLLPPLMRLLTTPAERRIRMAPRRAVSRKVRILFPVICFILCMMVVPIARGVLAMLFLGNLLRESGATARVSRTIGRNTMGIVTVLLAFGVGVSTTSKEFLSWVTVGVFLIGFLSLALSAAWGMLFARVMNLFARQKINPLLGAAGVTIAPVAARVVARLAAEEDPGNHLLKDALGVNVAAVIALAVTIGLMITMP